MTNSSVVLQTLKLFFIIEVFILICIMANNSSRRSLEIELILRFEQCKTSEWKYCDQQSTIQS